MDMVRSLTLFLFMPLLFVWGAVGAQNADNDLDNLICKESGAYEQSVQLRDLNTFEDLSFDLKYYRFEWTVDPAVYNISGTATPYFVSKTDGLTGLEFNLSTLLTIDAVKYHGVTIAFTQSGDYGLSITLPAPINSGTLDSLSITYHGAPPSGGFGSFIQSNHSGTPIIWTLSEPFGAQDWWPCKNGVTDKIDSIDVFVKTPLQNRVGSNGKLAAVTISGQDNVYHWKHRYPIAPYLVAIAVTNYEAYTNIVPLSNGTQLPMVNYVYPENLADAQNGTADLVQVLQFYDSLFVSYPFYKEKYGHAQFGWGGGMEHQTMSFVINYGWGLLSHELAHQWFGDMVTCGSWEDIWLNEGFATFLEGLTRERFQPGTPWLDWRTGKINSVITEAGGSVRVDDTTSVGRIFNGRLSYNKGSYLLHMLRWKLGDDNFFQGVRNYLNDRKYKYAKTPGFKAELEAASGQDLTEYFNDWYYGEGYPSYQVKWQQIGGELYIQLNQTSSSPASVPFFEMPVPLRLSNGGLTQMIRLDHSFDGQTFTVPVGFTVQQIDFDPDLKLLSAFNTVEQTQIVATEDPSLAARVRLSPNPAHDLLRIELLDQPALTVVHWQLFDALGRALKAGTMNDVTQNIPIGDLPTGLYQVKFTAGDRPIPSSSFLKN